MGNINIYLRSDGKFVYINIIKNFLILKKKIQQLVSTTEKSIAKYKSDNVSLSLSCSVYSSGFVPDVHCNGPAVGQTHSMSNFSLTSVQFCKRCLRRSACSPVACCVCASKLILWLLMDGELILCMLENHLEFYFSFSDFGGFRRAVVQHSATGRSSAAQTQWWAISFLHCGHMASDVKLSD